jgi:hypothetical protein
MTDGDEFISSSSRFKLRHCEQECTGGPQADASELAEL